MATTKAPALPWRAPGASHHSKPWRLLAKPQAVSDLPAAPVHHVALQLHLSPDVAAAARSHVGPAATGPPKPPVPPAGKVTARVGQALKTIRAYTMFSTNRF